VVRDNHGVVKVTMLGSLLFALACGVSSASTTPKPSCLKLAQTQPAMNGCAALWLKSADARLTVALHAAQKRFGSSVVHASQSAWVTYRNAECSAEASIYRGGSIYPLIYLTCEEALTDARTTQLASDLAHAPR
jgi:uncharacterized protein YecT (DUF1311 family)